MSEATQIDGDIQQDGFPARLRQSIASYGSVTALANAIQRSDGAVRKWLRGLSEPNVSDLRSICAVTGARIDWLVDGVGDSGLTSRVREPDAGYEVMAQSRMDNTLLEGIMSTVDEELGQRGIEVPSLKRAAMVVTLFSLFRDSKIIDREAVTRLVRLAD